MKSRVDMSQHVLELFILPLLDWISDHLIYCLSRGLSKNTIRFYQEKLEVNIVIRKIKIILLSGCYAYLAKVLQNY